MGIEDNHGMAWLAVADSTDFDMPAAKSRKRKQEREPSRLAGRVARLMPPEALRVRGIHNALNALAALALVRQLGLGWAGLVPALRDSRRTPHPPQPLRPPPCGDFFN